MSRARHHEKHGKHHHRDEGGRVGMKVSGNPDVFKEAEERKYGGRMKKKHEHEMHAEGKHAKHRRDRKHGGKAMHHDGMHHKHHMHKHHMHKGRKAGGRVGSDKAPLSSAHHGGAAGERAMGEPD